MSTRTRDSAPGKEKRGTSPSNTATATTIRRRSLDASTTTTSAIRRRDTTPPEKNIPNYLRPTLASSNDISKLQGKKPLSSTDCANKPTPARRRSFDNKPTLSSTIDVKPHGKKPLSSTDSASKPTLARRRSFDKPPSPSRTPKSRVSPSPALRSSSFSGKVSSSSPKGVSERSLKGSKDAAKQSTLYARPANTVKKGGILSKKLEHGSVSSRKERAISPPEKVDILNAHDVPESETLSENLEAFTPEAEVQTETIPVESHTEKEPQDSLLEAEVSMNSNEQTEGERDDKGAEMVTTESSPTILEQDDANVVTVESLIISENEDVKIVLDELSTVLENQDASVGVETGELEDKSQVEEISSEQQEIDEQTTDEMSNANTDESVAGDSKDEVEDEERKEAELAEEETGLNRNEEVDSGSEPHELSKEKEVQEAVVDEKKEAENAAPTVAHGKKDVALSNNVIEETAIKLREQRRNKVKALAGAFETVISLQEPK